MIFAGSQVYWDGAWAELVALAERAQIPVFTNAMGRGCIDSRHPLAFSQARKNAFRGTDLAIILGTPLDFRVGYGAGINAKAKIVQIERDPTKVAQNRDADVAILGDARSVLGQLAAAAPAPPPARPPAGSRSCAAPRPRRPASSSTTPPPTPGRSTTTAWPRPSAR
jgi:acetolactate synthase-1/2/3 large subunit